jgi:hypothetical protein
MFTDNAKCFTAVVASMFALKDAASDVPLFKNKRKEAGKLYFPHAAKWT